MPALRLEDDALIYEPTQKGNPHRLAVKQHTFPKTSIARFVGQKGNVELFLKSRDKVIQAKPSNEIFCAERVWISKRNRVS